MFRNAMGLLLTALAMTLTSCNGCGSGSNVHVDESPVIALEGQKGQVQANMGGGKLNLPADFPADVPQVPGAELLLASHSPQGITITFHTTRPAEEVSQFYTTQLAEQGWAAPQVRTSGGAHVIAATKENRRIVVSIAEDSGKARVTLSVTATN